jgi:hypothetical protein
MPRGVKLTKRQHARRILRRLRDKAERISHELWLVKSEASGLKRALEDVDFAGAGERIGAFVKSEAAHFEEQLRLQCYPLSSITSQIRELDRLLNPEP